MDLAANVLLPHLVGKSPEVSQSGRVGLSEPVEDFAAFHGPSSGVLTSVHYTQTGLDRERHGQIAAHPPTCGTKRAGVFWTLTLATQVCYPSHNVPGIV